MKYFTIGSEDSRLDVDTRSALRGSFIELSDGVTHYELAGPADGQVVVLVPGLTIPLFYWDAFVERLHNRGLRTLAYSAYGRGYSDRITTVYDEALFARQLQDLITGLRLPSRQHVVGTSMGALVAMRHFAEHPDSVATFTLVGPAGLTTASRQQRLLRHDWIATLMAKRFGGRMLLDHLSDDVADPALGAELTAMVADTYRYEGSMYGYFSTMQNFPFFEQEPLFRAAGQQAAPKLLMWGSEDRVTPISALATVGQLLQPSNTHVLGCGHMAPYERPAEVAEHFLAFLATNSDRKTS